MKPRIFLYLSLFTLHYSLCNAQTWEPVGGGIACSEKAFELENEYKDTLRGQVITLCVYSDKLYAGGLFTSAGNTPANNVAMWDGHKWSALGTGTDGRVESFGIHRNILVMGGVFERANGKIARGLAIWVDTVNSIPSWYYFPRGVYKLESMDVYSGKKLIYDHDVEAICDFKGVTYIGGWYCLAERDAPGTALASWTPNKKMWEPLKNKVPDSINMDMYYGLNSLTVYKGKLYAVASPLGNYPSLNGILIWNGTRLSQPANFHEVSVKLKCVTSSDSGLYFAGYALNSATGSYPIIKMNNDGTYKLIKCLPSGGTINTMVYHNGKLYVAGYFNHIGSISANNIAMWDGKSWHAMGAGLSNEKHFTKIECLCIYKGYLYAGGSFDHSGNKPIENIASWKLTDENHDTGR